MRMLMIVKKVTILIEVVMNDDQDNDLDNSFNENYCWDIIFFFLKNGNIFDAYDNSYVLFTYTFNDKSVGDEFQCLVPYPSHSNHRHHQGHLHPHQGHLHLQQGRRQPQQGCPHPHPEHVR
jgi:hypothetical protein